MAQNKEVVQSLASNLLCALCSRWRITAVNSGEGYSVSLTNTKSNTTWVASPRRLRLARGLIAVHRDEERSPLLPDPGRQLRHRMARCHSRPRSAPRMPPLIHALAGSAHGVRSRKLVRALSGRDPRRSPHEGRRELRAQAGPESQCSKPGRTSPPPTREGVRSSPSHISSRLRQVDEDPSVIVTHSP